MILTYNDEKEEILSLSSVEEIHKTLERRKEF